jgi:two-component system CheB/CheR fusion protein
MAHIQATPSEVTGLLYRFALQSREHAVILLDPEGRVTWLNPGAEQIFGYSSADMAGKKLDRLFTPLDEQRGAPEHELEVARADRPAPDDRWQQRSDGSRFWASGLLVALRGEDGSLLGFAKVLRNRTDMKEQIETLRNQAAVFAQTAARQEALLATAAHELANPVGPILNAVAIIRNALKPAGDVEYALRVIDRQAELLRKLVQDLMEFSRIGMGKVVLDVARIPMQPLLTAAADDCRRLFEEKRHELRLLMQGPPVEVEADASRLQQVFVNLLTNAAKYTHPGGRVSLRLTTEGEEAVVRVTDTGIGIPRDVLPVIFELFTQVDGARAMSMGGLGIGLSVVKDIVQLHGGSVQVESEGAGKGSEFTVRLPLAPGERDTIAAPRSAS